MRKISTAAVLITMLLTTAACSGLSTTDQRVLSGGAIGAGVGALVTGGVAGAAVGGAVGAGAGYIYDRSDRR